MKKSFLLNTVLFFVLVMFFSPLELAAVAQEEELEPSRRQQDEWNQRLNQRFPRPVLCYDITAEVLEGMKTKKKSIKGGVIILVKSDDPAALQKFRETLATCKENPQSPKQLVGMRGVEMTVTDIPEGVQVQLTSKNSKLVRMIKSVKIKAPTKKSKKS